MKLEHVEPAEGRYVLVNLDGRPCRVYFEHAGHGIALLCLHTAGSDGRQYRDLLNDTGVTDRFQVIVPDMPWHGKSSPPAGWQEQTYTLTTDGYLAFVLAFMDALALDQPVVMGCSIGGRVVLHLALRYPQRARAVIGLQSGLHAGRDTNDPSQMDYLHRYDIHGGEASAAAVSGLMAPDSPADDRWETLWHYASGGPGVFRGDLHYYFIDGDLRNQALTIDQNRCAVYLLSGEYDYSAPPEGAAEIADRIGCYFVRMEGLGHFPMSEHPARFRRYLLPVLDRIADPSSA
ncbi:MAG: alpha/beta hydrolase [Proteobacteria bacterium]|jgi:pimeloyl-ACP methyl ester carboxylesterase|nr:alpha/beta hydrolase [Pseudomonadota bacterium]MDA1301856.1 alpha/beta hydrolase [Pseudomonadota bacterium]